jgi:hypothetical protein
MPPTADASHSTTRSGGGEGIVAPGVPRSVSVQGGTIPPGAFVEASVFRRPGERVVLREVWGGRIWSARPATVVQDSPEVIALYLAPGAAWMRACAPTGERLALPLGEWRLARLTWPASVLRLHRPGASHDVMLFWSPDHARLTGWYVNFQTPLVRTALGFDFTDEFLDLTFTPDLAQWAWRDEDELAEALRLGLLTRQRAAELRAEGKRVVAEARAHAGPFAPAWRAWRPEPAWPLPELPAGWEAPPAAGP